MNQLAQKNNSEHSLQEAFSQFSACSEELIATYRLLQEQVSILSDELALARAARHQEMLENQRLNSRLHGLLEVLPAGVIVVDQLGVIEEANPLAYELLGDGLVGLSWNKVLSWSAAEDATVSGEVRLNNQRWISIIATELPVENRKLYLLVEVTRTRELQDKLVQHQRLSAMGEMVAELAHQIRTPLTAARLSVDCLKRQALAESSIKPLRRIETQLLSLEQLVNDLLIFARRGEFEGHLLRTCSWLESFLALVRERYGDAVKVNVESISDYSILANEDLLSSALDNVIHNALEAAGGQVELGLTLYAEDQSLQLEIRDNGPGVPAELQDQIFEPFFSTSGRGTGLGLAVTRAIVEGHGGTIEYLPVEHGACFLITLPLAQQAMLSGPAQA